MHHDFSCCATADCTMCSRCEFKSNRITADTRRRTCRGVAMCVDFTNTAAELMHTRKTRHSAIRKMNSDSQMLMPTGNELRQCLSQAIVTNVHMNSQTQNEMGLHCVRHQSNDVKLSSKSARSCCVKCECSARVLHSVLSQSCNHHLCQIPLSRKCPWMADMNFDTSMRSMATLGNMSMNAHATPGFCFVVLITHSTTLAMLGSSSVSQR